MNSFRFQERKMLNHRKRSARVENQQVPSRELGVFGGE
jgi:hypothetical protein